MTRFLWRDHVVRGRTYRQYLTRDGTWTTNAGARRLFNSETLARKVHDERRDQGARIGIVP